MMRQTIMNCMQRHGASNGMSAPLFTATSILGTAKHGKPEARAVRELCGETLSYKSTNSCATNLFAWQRSTVLPAPTRSTLLFVAHYFKQKNKMPIPTITLNDGNKIPILGLGTWGSPKGQVCQAVKDAIDIGYRHIDCAHVYENEHEVGAGIAEMIKQGVVKREDLYVVSKLWNTFHKPELVRGACEATLKNLGLKQLDLYLIHWPMGYKEGSELFPKNADGTTAYSDADYVDTWKAMEELVASGLTKSIGISNFNKRQTDRILQTAKIPPAVNQVECHPYLTQKKLMEYCKSKNIALTAYSPLGSPNRPWAQKGDPVLMEDPKIVALAKKYQKTAAQILIRYQLQRGNITIPKSVTRERIITNFEVFNFELSAEDLAIIDSFDCNGRLVPLTGDVKHEHYPFGDEF